MAIVEGRLPSMRVGSDAETQVNGLFLSIAWREEACIMAKYFAKFAVIISVLVSRSASAEESPVIYSNINAFIAATVSLRVETFDSANVGDGSVATTVSPLNSSSNDSVFTAGSIAEGIEFWGTYQGVPEALLVMGAESQYSNIGPTSAKLISTVSDANFIHIRFSPAVTALSFRVFGESDKVSIWFGSSSGTPTLASVKLFASSATGTFFGVTWAKPIEYINIAAPEVCCPTPGPWEREAIGDVRFGRALRIFADGFESDITTSWSDSFP